MAVNSAALAAPPGLLLPTPTREFEFAEADFRNLAKLAREQTGIVLAETKSNLVYSRLARRLRALGLTSFGQYWDYLQGEKGTGEIENFINSISTNHTKFFREEHHLEHLHSHVAAPFAKSVKGRGRLRIWSAGCSTGEEPYSIALVLQTTVPDIEKHDVRILATDIDTDVLAKASAAEYPASGLGDIPAKYHGDVETDDSVMVMSDRVRSLIAYRQLNLLTPWPFKGPFDAIFCRNVMIYFDNDTKTALVERFAQMLKPGGWLYIGHSETLLTVHANLQLVGRTTYRRKA
ncbi:MAG TPA: protein-glutamate O-methyltransferase CheR [Pseudolabrys sp.]|nr:protein-glutamate O-methyltransferase CheR [Pseudolabrys sp.]